MNLPNKFQGLYERPENRKASVAENAKAADAAGGDGEGEKKEEWFRGFFFKKDLADSKPKEWVTELEAQWFWILLHDVLHDVPV
jgi:hypothetical protein